MEEEPIYTLNISTFFTDSVDIIALMKELERVLQTYRPYTDELYYEWSKVG